MSVISLVLAAHSAAAGSLDGRRGPLLYRARSWQRVEKRVGRPTEGIAGHLRHVPARLHEDG